MKSYFFLADLKKQKIVEKLKKNSQIEFEFLFYSELPHETRTSFLSPLVY